jgi:hypothetical protein
MAQWSGGQVGESSMRRSYWLPGGYSGIHLAPPLARLDKTTCGRAAREASEWVQPTWGSADPSVGPIASVFVQVTARWVSRLLWGCLHCFYPFISWLWAFGSASLLLIGRECASLDR